jgi:hypothetical protein
MSIYYNIRGSHEKIRRLLEETLEYENEEKIRDLLFETKKEFILTLEVEEVVFYKVFNKNPNLSSKIKHLLRLHEKMKVLSCEMCNMFDLNANWQKKLLELKNNFHHYTRQEERFVFKKAKEVITKEQELKLGIRFIKLKKTRYLLYIWKMMYGWEKIKFNKIKKFYKNILQF